MTILFRYLLREYFKVFAMCFGGLMTVYLVVDFFEKVRKFIRHDADITAILEFFLLRTPAISFQIAPLGVLMATLLTLGLLSRNHEITAMSSCGISLYRIASPFLCFAMAVSLTLLVFSAVIIPVTSAEAEYVKTVKIEKKLRPPTFSTLRPWIQISNQTLMNVEIVDPDGLTLRGVNLYHLGDQFQLTAITEAKEAHYTEQGWVLFAGLQRQLFPDGRVAMTQFDRTPIQLSQTPEDFHTWLSTDSEEMTLMELRAYIDRLQRDGYPVARHLTDYYGRIAFPFVSLIMVVVGVALSLRQSGTRGGGVAIGVGQALVLGFLYWASHSVSIALGRSGALTPVIAGWMANLLFLSFGGYLISKVRM